MDWRTIYEVVRVLSGGIEPIGDEAYDHYAFIRMETLMDLINALIEDIRGVARYATRPKWSMATAGKAAQEWLKNEARSMIDVTEKEEKNEI